MSGLKRVLLCGIFHLLMWAPIDWILLSQQSSPFQTFVELLVRFVHARIPRGYTHVWHVELPSRVQNTGRRGLCMQCGRAHFWDLIECKSSSIHGACARGDFWAQSVEIRVFPSSIGNMLTSFGFSLLIISRCIP